ncbi:putative ABC transport system permease [Legionella geestiana]|uniref:Putative ABC transport system permease n=1 Tax=Legionella geestiana TaxID=45065 RepID=A0A0W0UAI0_9GAMM|nr:ABC transporter permease [Legionella geestiana]KTD04837.1 putative ABC transport system permease [Legionella geestiana]STX54016.1 ABC transport system permease [Legionella geestiana]
MRFFFRIGLLSQQLIRSLVLFFGFLGHLGSAFRDFLLLRITVSLMAIQKIIYHSGAKIIMPLSIISLLAGMSASISARSLLARYNLQRQAMAYAQAMLINDMLPIFIGLVLSVQTALNAIDETARIMRQQRTPDDVMTEYVLPTLFGVMLTALLLYIYLFAISFTSLYYSFHYLQGTNFDEYLAHLDNSFSLAEYLISLAKTLFFGAIAAFGACYYYYYVSIYRTQQRRVVSRILTRSAFWMIVMAALIKFMVV